MCSTPLSPNYASTNVPDLVETRTDASENTSTLGSISTIGSHSTLNGGSALGGGPLFELGDTEMGVARSHHTMSQQYATRECSTPGMNSVSTVGQMMRGLEAPQVKTVEHLVESWAREVSLENDQSLGDCSECKDGLTLIPDRVEHKDLVGLNGRQFSNDTKSSTSEPDRTDSGPLKQAILLDKADSEGNILLNVRFDGCDRHSLTMFNCRWKNVRFINCKLHNVEFRNVVITNVDVRYVELNNVMLSDVELDQHSWKDMSVQDAMLVHQGSHAHQREWITALEPFAPLPTTTIRHKDPGPLLSRGTLDPTDEIKSIRSSVHVALLPPKNLPARVFRSENVITRIAGYFVRDTHRKPADHLREHFSTVDTTAYTISVFEPRSMDYLPLLHTDNRCRSAVNKCVYGRSHHIQLDLSSDDQNNLNAIETLKKHRSDPVQALLLFYHFEGDDPHLVHTKDTNWHKLMSYIRHEFPLIPEIHLIIGPSFWNRIMWSWGRPSVVAVMKQKDLRNDSRDFYDNFLFEFAKFAAPVKRTHISELDRMDGSTLRLFVDGTVSAEKISFVEELQDEINRRARLRPLYDGVTGKSWDIY